MISYRQADIFKMLTDKEMEVYSPLADRILQIWKKYCTEHRSPPDYPDWQQDRCRCENNGDYCEYCEEFMQAKEEEQHKPKTFERLWYALATGDDKDLVHYLHYFMATDFPTIAAVMKDEDSRNTLKKVMLAKLKANPIKVTVP